MDGGGEIGLGDPDSNQNSLLSCSPSATSLDIDGWFSYLSAQQEGIVPQLQHPLSNEKTEIFGEAALMLDQFEDWDAHELDKILECSGAFTSGIAELDLSGPLHDALVPWSTEQPQEHGLAACVAAANQQSGPSLEKDGSISPQASSIGEDPMLPAQDRGPRQMEETAKRKDGDNDDGDDGDALGTQPSIRVERRGSLTWRRKRRRESSDSSFSSTPASTSQPSPPLPDHGSAAPDHQPLPSSPAVCSPSISPLRGPSSDSSPSLPLSPSSGHGSRLVVKMRRVGTGLTCQVMHDSTSANPITPQPSLPRAQLGSGAKQTTLVRAQVFALFCRQEKERMTEEERAAMSPQELQKKCAERWRALSNLERDRLCALVDELQQSGQAKQTDPLSPSQVRGRKALERKERLLAERKKTEEERMIKLVDRMTGKMVIPRLYLGNKHVASNEAWFAQSSCTHVLNVTTEVRNYFEGNEGISYHRIRVSDDSDRKIAQFFEEGTDFIHRVIGNFVERKFVDKRHLREIKPELQTSLEGSAALNGGEQKKQQPTPQAQAETGSQNESSQVVRQEDDPVQMDVEGRNAADTVPIKEKDAEDGLNGPSVLVHCSEGRSRSPTLIIAYLMRYCNWSLKRAYEHLSNLSQYLNINEGFKRQLMDYEKQVHSLETPSLDFFQRTTRAVVRRAISLGGQASPALDFLRPQSDTPFAFISPMTSRKFTQPLVSVPQTSPKMETINARATVETAANAATMRRPRSTGSSHFQSKARQLPSFTPPIPVKRKRVIHKKICDEALMVQRKIDVYLAPQSSHAGSSGKRPLPLGPPSHSSTKRKQTTRPNKKRDTTRRGRSGEGNEDEDEAEKENSSKTRQAKKKPKRKRESVAGMGDEDEWSKDADAAAAEEEEETEEDALDKRKQRLKTEPRKKTGPRDSDRVQEMVAPELGNITILYPFDEETVKTWSSARLTAWKLRHENANAYYYRFEDPVVKQSHRASTEQKQENHEAFMARYKEFVREGWIIGTAWGLFSKAVPGFVGYQCANYYRKLVKDGLLKDKSYTTDEKGELKKLQRASSKGGNETLNNQLNGVWKTPEVKWIESCVQKWVEKYHAKGSERAKGKPRKMRKSIQAEEEE